MEWCKDPYDRKRRKGVSDQLMTNASTQRDATHKDSSNSGTKTYPILFPLGLFFLAIKILHFL